MGCLFDLHSNESSELHRREDSPQLIHSIRAAETAAPQHQPGDLVVQASRLHIPALIEEKRV
jgi:hypothetical protein